MIAPLPLHSQSGHRPRVVVAGGGIAGAEALLALRALAGHRIDLDLVAPEPDLVHRPLAVAEPFGTGEARRFPLAELCESAEARLHGESLTFVDTARHRVETSGAPVDYDALVVAVGAVRRSWLPGAVTFDGTTGVSALREIIGEVDAGGVHSVAFALPVGATWALPLYELALMTAARQARAVRVAIATPEERPLEIFGEAASDRVRAVLAERGVELVTGAHALQVAPGLLLTTAGTLAAERVVVLPRVEGPRIGGLPCDAAGFLPVDEHGAVAGAPDVYAAGDGTDCAVKQGGLAAQQADAAAAAIAARAGAPCSAEPFRPSLRGQLLTGDTPVYLRTLYGGLSEAGETPLWWPPGKVAARYLAPYLAARDRRSPMQAPTLADRPGDTVYDREGHEAMREVALLFADQAAADGDRPRALRWLDAAEQQHGLLPPEYVTKRREWGKVAS